jgi:hypothetical protein
LACLDERLDEPAFIVNGVGNPDVSDDVARHLGNVARVTVEDHDRHAVLAEGSHDRERHRITRDHDRRSRQPGITPQPR